MPLATSPSPSLASELGEDRRRVEVHALADDPVSVGLELKYGDHSAGELLAGRLEAAQRPAVGALQIEFGDHGSVGVVQRDQLVALVGETPCASP